MENDILDSLNDLGYEGPLLDETAFSKALDGGPKSLEYTKLIHILAEELKKLCQLEETVNMMNDADESSSFLLELSSFLKELGCPYKNLVTGHMSSRLQTKEDRVLLLDYLISELMAARMVQVDKPKEKSASTMDIVMHESPTAKDLKEILIRLKFNKPPPNITPEVLFSKLEAKLKDTMQKEGDQLVGKPLYNKAMAEKDWKQLDTTFNEMFEEYRLRRETLITRLECTIQSFEWSDRLKNKKDLIQSTYRPKREQLKVKPDVRYSDFLAARTSLLLVEKTSNANVRKNTQTDVNKVIIGQVPDRGGRPNEQQPPPPEMPSWQQRAPGSQDWKYAAYMRRQREHWSLTASQQIRRMNNIHYKPGNTSMDNLHYKTENTSMYNLQYKTGNTSMYNLQYKTGNTSMDNIHYKPGNTSMNNIHYKTNSYDGIVSQPRWMEGKSENSCMYNMQDKTVTSTLDNSQHNTATSDNVGSQPHWMELKSDNSGMDIMQDKTGKINMDKIQYKPGISSIDNIQHNTATSYDVGSQPRWMDWKTGNRSMDNIQDETERSMDKILHKTGISSMDNLENYTATLDNVGSHSRSMEWRPENSIYNMQDKTERRSMDEKQYETRTHSPLSQSRWMKENPVIRRTDNTHYEIRASDNIGSDSRRIEENPYIRNRDNELYTTKISDFESQSRWMEGRPKNRRMDNMQDDTGTRSIDNIQYNTSTRSTGSHSRWIEENSDFRNMDNIHHNTRTSDSIDSQSRRMDERPERRIVDKGYDTRTYSSRSPSRWIEENTEIRKMDNMHDKTKTHSTGTPSRWMKENLVISVYNIHYNTRRSDDSIGSQSLWMERRSERRSMDNTQYGTTDSFGSHTGWMEGNTEIKSMDNINYNTRTPDSIGSQSRWIIRSPEIRSMENVQYETRSYSTEYKSHRMEEREEIRDRDNKQYNTERHDSTGSQSSWIEGRPVIRSIDNIEYKDRPFNSESQSHLSQSRWVEGSTEIRSMDNAHYDIGTRTTGSHSRWVDEKPEIRSMDNVHYNTRTSKSDADIIRSKSRWMEDRPELRIMDNIHYETPARFGSHSRWTEERPEIRSMDTHYNTRTPDSIESQSRWMEGRPEMDNIQYETPGRFGSQSHYMEGNPDIRSMDNLQYKTGTYIGAQPSSMERVPETRNMDNIEYEIRRSTGLRSRRMQGSPEIRSVDYIHYNTGSEDSIGSQSRPMEERCEIRSIDNFHSKSHSRFRTEEHTDISPLVTRHSYGEPGRFKSRDNSQYRSGSPGSIESQSRWSYERQSERLSSQTSIRPDEQVISSTLDRHRKQTGRSPPYIVFKKLTEAPKEKRPLIAPDIRRHPNGRPLRCSERLKEKELSSSLEHPDKLGKKQLRKQRAKERKEALAAIATSLIDKYVKQRSDVKSGKLIATTGSCSDTKSIKRFRSEEDLSINHNKRPKFVTQMPIIKQESANSIAGASTDTKSLTCASSAMESAVEDKELSSRLKHIKKIEKRQRKKKRAKERKAAKAAMAKSLIDKSVKQGSDVDSEKLIATAGSSSDTKSIKRFRSEEDLSIDQTKRAKFVTQMPIVKREIADSIAGASADTKSLKRAPMESSIDELLKRVRSEQELTVHVKKSLKTDELKSTDQASNSESSKALTNIRVSIRNKEPMSEIQSELVKDGILKAILDAPKDDKEPNFGNCTFQNSCLQIVLKNEYSLEWMEERIESIKPWPEAQLSLVNESEVLKSRVGTVFVPNSELECPDEALKLLQKQNKLNTKSWKILMVQSQIKGNIITLSIDNASIRALRKMEFRPYLGFRKVFIRILGESIKTNADGNPEAETI